VIGQFLTAIITYDYVYARTTLMNINLKLAKSHKFKKTLETCTNVV